MEGNVKFVKKNGFGFITAEDKQEYFFHTSDYMGDWEALLQVCPPIAKVGVKVSFTPTEGVRGLRAKNVELSSN